MLFRARYLKKETRKAAFEKAIKVKQKEDHRETKRKTKMRY